MPARPTLAHCLANYICPFCSEPLGRYHAYHLHQPGQILSQLADQGPTHLGCIEARLEEIAVESVSAVTCIATVRAAATNPSGRLLTLPHPANGEPTTHIHLFTPDSLRFLHLSAYPSPGDGVHTITRPATPAEIMAWMKPALDDALAKAASQEEHRTILHQLGLIQSRLPAEERPAFRDYVRENLKTRQSGQ